MLRLIYCLLLILALPLTAEEQDPTYGGFIKNPNAAKDFAAYREARKNLSNVDAYKKMSELVKKYPDEVLIVAQHGALMGDYAESRPLAERKKLKAESLRILEKASQTDFKDPVGFPRKIILNEYYYQSRQFKKQYELGVDLDRRGSDGTYCVGVGASMYALELYEKKDKQYQFYANKALDAWKKYKDRPLENENVITFYIIALALTGDLDGARKFFTKSDYKINEIDPDDIRLKQLLWPK